MQYAAHPSWLQILHNRNSSDCGKVRQTEHGMLMQFAAKWGCSTTDGWFWPAVQKYWWWMHCTTWQFVSAHHRDPFAVTYSALHQYRCLPLNFPALQFVTILNLQLVPNHFDNLFWIPNNSTTRSLCVCLQFQCTWHVIARSSTVIFSVQILNWYRKRSCQLRCHLSAAQCQLGCIWSARLQCASSAYGRLSAPLWLPSSAAMLSCNPLAQSQPFSSARHVAWAVVCLPIYSSSAWLLSINLTGMYQLERVISKLGCNMLQ